MNTKYDLNFGPCIVRGFRPETEKFDFGKKMVSSERASQEEQSDANLSSIAPSSEELLKTPYVCMYPLH